MSPTHPGRPSPTAVGDRTELEVLYRLNLAGLSVYKDTCHSAGRDDMVVRDIDGSLFGIQVKTACLRQGTVRFRTCSVHGHRGKPEMDYKGQVDFIVAWCPDTDAIYVVRPEDAPGKVISLRVAPPANGQVKSVRWAGDYKFRPGTALQALAGPTAAPAGEHLDTTG